MYAPGVVDGHSGLLSWALAVVEAMQRSSSKQLTTHLLPPLLQAEAAATARARATATATVPVSTAPLQPPQPPVVVGRASFELRAQREREVFCRVAALAAGAGPGAGQKKTGGVTAAAVVQVLLEVCALQSAAPSTAPSAKGEKEEEVIVVVKDIKHSLLLTMRYDQ